jgi:hypothetical protein
MAQSVALSLTGFRIKLSFELIDFGLNANAIRFRSRGTSVEVLQLNSSHI